MKVAELERGIASALPEYKVLYERRLRDGEECIDFYVYLDRGLDMPVVGVHTAIEKKIIAKMNESSIPKLTKLYKSAFDKFIEEEE